MPGKRARGHFSQLSEFERGLIIRMKTAGWSTRRVAGQVDHPECAVRNCWKQWTRDGTHARKTRSGATRKTTRRADRRIEWQALVDPTVTRSTIRADVGVAIVPQTISRHLAEANLKSNRPFRALPLTPEHRQLRLQWCQARSMWNVTDWQKVVFSDESRFVFGTDDNRVRVWRRPGSPGAIFQQDNARPHTARVPQDFLRHFETLPWPARSHDSSPVKHVWNQLKRQMPSCHSVHDLELAVQDLWAHLTQDNIRCLINSMLDRVAARIAATLELEVVQRAVEVAQYLCRCTPCIRLIVLFLRSSESLICVITCIKFHFNPMLSAWVAIFNIPECILMQKSNNV
ncbi:transposable element Tc1 transposase [Trichonephila clavipes]|nr:transposable element Tc1 transposase [Trichonephila clavipes]